MIEDRISFGPNTNFYGLDLVKLRTHRKVLHSQQISHRVDHSVVLGLELPRIFGVVLFSLLPPKAVSRYGLTLILGEALLDVHNTPALTAPFLHKKSSFRKSKCCFTH